MTKKDVDKMARDVREIVKEFEASPDKAIAFLHGTGMYTKKGNLKKQFQ